MGALRIVFMGTPDFAIPALRALHQSRHQVVAVYCQPPRPAGRGMAPQKSPVQRFAETAGIPVFIPENFKNHKDRDQFRSLKPDIAIVAAYGLILPEEILDTPRRGCINIHASLLPRWRGAAPIQYAILKGDRETGISIMLMDKGLDTGPVYSAKSIPIAPDETGGSLHDKLAVLAGEMIAPVLDQLTSAMTFPRPQDSSQATHAPKIKKEDAHLSWQGEAELTERMVRAFTPWPGAFFIYEGDRIRVIHGEVAEGEGIPGQVLDNNLTVACGSGAYRVTRLQKEGKKEMSAEEFLRGSPFRRGAILE